MFLSFENELGKIEMSGGENGYNWRITAIEGLALPQKEFQQVTYAGVDGQSTLSERLQPRTITIGGDVQSSQGLQQELTRATQIFHRKGWLKLQLGNKQRKIEGRCVSFELNGRNGAAAPFVLQLICDQPHFGDFENTRVFVFQLIAGLNGSFTPSETVFSQRHTEANVRNRGDSSAEPVFMITNTKADIDADIDATITIKNQTNNQQFKFNYPSKKGETITIDIPNRTMRNGAGESILHTITDDTFLSDFWLEQGNNLVSVLPPSDSDQEISAACIFNNPYIEAVV